MGVYAEQSSQVDLLENQDDQPLLPLEEGQEEQYTGDGSVDIHGRPSMRQNTGNWRACPFVLGNECCERLAYYGININLVTYLITKLHEGNADAAKNVNNWSGTCYLTPLLGAVLADAYWGRYWTIAVFSTIYFIVCLNLAQLLSGFQSIYFIVCLNLVQLCLAFKAYSILFFNLFIFYCYEEWT